LKVSLSTKSYNSWTKPTIAVVTSSPSFLTLLRHFLNTESASKALKKKLNALRKNKDFYKRQKLADLVEVITKDTLKLKKSIQQELDKFLDDLSKKIDSDEANNPLKAINQMLKDSLFDTLLFDDEFKLNVQILVISIIASQRDAKIKVTELPESQQKKSDALFIEQLKNFQQNLQQDKTKGFNELTQRINRLRIHPQFLRYVAMLKETTLEEKIALLKEPILNLLRYPLTDKIAIVKAVFKNYVTEKELIDPNFDTNLMETALNDQYAKFRAEKLKAIPDINSYLLKALSTFEGVEGLEKIVERLIKDYHQTGLGDLQKELKKPLPSINIIISKFKEILKKDLSQELIKRINDQLKQDIVNKNIMKVLREGINTDNPWQTFIIGITTKILPKAEERPEFLMKVLNEINEDFFMTPRDVWNLFSKSLTKQLTKENFDFGKFVQNYPNLGILFLVFQYFIDEVNRNANKSKTREMLSRSLQVLNTSKITGEITAISNVENWLRAKNPKRPMEAFLAPVIVDSSLDGAKKGLGFYSGQIKQGQYGKKLTSLFALINRKESQAIVENIRKLASTKKYNVNQKKLDSFLKKLKDALDKNFQE